MMLPLQRSSIRATLSRSSGPLGAVLVGALLLTGCSKKDESTASSAPTEAQSSSRAAIELVSHAPEESFLLVAYDGESEGGKRSYTESLKTVRKFIRADTRPTNREKATGEQKETPGGVSTDIRSPSSPRSLETVQQELAEMLEASGFLSHEPGSVPPYREVVLFAAAGDGDGLVNGGLCASGPDFSRKLDALIGAARTRGYEVVEQSFGSSKGYAVSTELAPTTAQPNAADSQSDEEQEETDDPEDRGTEERSSRRRPETKTTAEAKGNKVTVFLGSSPDGVIGMGSIASAVTHCLHPEKKALPPIVTSPTVKRIVERHPDTEEDFLRVYFDLDLFKQALESKRDTLEKLLGENENKGAVKPSAPTCGPEESCQAPNGGSTLADDDQSEEVASSLPSLQDSITRIGQLPSRTFFAKGSFDSKNAVTMRLVTLLEKDQPQAAPFYKAFEESSFPNAIASIPPDAAILLGLHSPVEKALPLLPLIENSPYAPVKTVRSVALAVLGLPAGSLAPELGVVVESSQPAELSKLVKTALTPLLQGGGVPVSSWQNKAIEGVQTSFTLTPFGFGIFIAEPAGAVVVGTTEAGIARLLATHKTASPEKAAEALKVARGTHAPLAARIDGVQLAKMLRGLQSTLRMLMPKESNSLDTAHLDQLQSLGTMLVALEFDKGFTEIVWRKVPSSPAPTE